MKQGKSTKGKLERSNSHRGSAARSDLERMISEAIIDCYNDDEQAMGLFNMVAENVILPFTTVVLGLPVVVETIELNDAAEIVAVCSHGRKRQRISIVDLPLPSTRPTGSEWIDAYRLWSKGR